MTERTALRPNRTPGPAELPLLGSTVPMLRDPLEFLTRISREHGDIVEFHLAGKRILLLNHPTAIEEALRTHSDSLIKDDFTRRLSIVVGNGLLTSEGDFWRRQRKLAQPAFHHHRIQTYADTMVRHAERTAADFKQGETRDIHLDMMRLTLDIVAETLFGVDVGHAAQEIGDALEIFSARFSTFDVFIPLWVPTPANRRALKTLKRFDEVIYRVIRERRAQPGTGDLLSMLLAATTEDGGKMSDAQLRDEVVTLLLAGHETTALVLSFALHLLGRDARVRAKLEAQIASVLRDRAATMADIPSLSYADQIVRETMRLFPPAWAIGREAREARTIAGVDVKVGEQLWMAQWVVHRDPRYFPDPESFEPERWSDDLAKRLPRYAYFPFGGGARICIGNAFAMMEAVLLLVTVVQRVRLSPVDGRPLLLNPSVTLRPKDGVRMRVERRVA